MMAVFVVQLLFLYLLQCSDVSIARVCIPSSIAKTGAHPIPQIPSRWRSIVEITPTNGASSFARPTVLTMNADWMERKLSALDETSNAYSQDIFDYKGGNKVMVRDKSCTVMKGEFSPFGAFPPNVNGSLQMNDLFYLQKKYNVAFQSVVNGSDGLKYENWQGCVDEKNVSLRTQYFFTSGKSQLLLALFLKGYAIISDKNVTIEKVYSFKNMRSITGALTQGLYPPPDVYCGVFKDPNCKFPEIPKEFEMNVEVKRIGRKYVANTREYYDVNENLHRSDHHVNNSKGIIVPVHEIHDFNTGVAYLINSQTTRCSMSPIKSSSWDSTDADQHHHIQMKTARQLFGISGSTFECKGIDAVRGIPAKVITSKEKGTKMFSNQTMIHTWYFSKPDWKVIGMEGPADTVNVPLKSVLYTKNMSFSMDYYNFDPIEPTTHILWILRYCFVNNRHYMYFRINSQYDEYVSNQKIVIAGLRNAVANAAKISKLRVSSILIFKSSYNGVIAVRLYVLGTPAVKGTIQILHPKHLTPLKEAVNNIKTAITKGKLTFNVKLMGKTPNVVTMHVQPHSYYDNSMDAPLPQPTKPAKASKSRAGVSGGAAAGIAIALFFIAIVLTVVVIHYILKRHGTGLFRHMRFTNDPLA